MPRASRRVITREQYDAVLLDLDGVITDTANVHAACWKQMFDQYLQKRATFRAFDLTTDYLLYVDGKPRFDGVRAFLDSRAIQLPERMWWSTIWANWLTDQHFMLSREEQPDAPS